MLEKDDIEELLGQALVNDQGKNVAQGLDEIAFSGVLLRRRAAIAAMAALISVGRANPEATAEEAVAFADALLKELAVDW